MVSLVFPEYPFRTRMAAGKRQIFDPARRRWVIFTPEEWVRQNFIQYLLQIKLYPISMIAVEKEMLVGELKKRFDLLVYDQQHQPWLMLECKAMDIAVNDAVVHQILRYNIAIPVKYLVVTNGTNTWCFEKGGGALRSMSDLPDWGE